MSAEPKLDPYLEIAHILFIDVVGYSKLLMHEQSEVLQQLNQIVRNTEQFRKGDAAGKLIRIPVGDGMALVFFDNPEAPVRAAVEISGSLQNYPQIRVRMGIHSGPVNEVLDVNDRSNVAGAGINMAQRVMECGDAGHILLSKRVADDLAPFGHWRSQLHDLGDCEVKHGESVFLVNFYDDKIGNRQLPRKLRQARQEAAKPIATEATSPIPTKRKSVPVLAFVLMALGLAVGAVIFFYATSPKFRGTPASENVAAAIPEKSIAVLPFENLSKDEENAFFAGGVQDEILADLAKIADLKVISRTSVMKYKSGPERNLREIAKTLGVAHVVEGSVQRAGGRIRVNAQLIDARTDIHLWAEHYDRDFADVFAIQSEIAQKIADQLRSKLSPAERAAIAEHPTEDLIAYALYAEAKEIFVWNNWEGAEKSLTRKVELLEKATQRDPSFALAYCAFAKAQDELYEMNGDRTHLDLAKKAVDTALRIRPDLGETHRELAFYYFHTGDFDRAHDELTIARRTLPNDAVALWIAGRIDRHRNRWDDSLANLLKASELDPRNHEIEYHLQFVYRLMRRYSECEQRLANNALSDLRPDFWRQLALAQLKLDKGDPVAAQALLAQVPLEFSPTEEIWDTRFTTALYLRDCDAVNRVIAATPAKWADDVVGGHPPESWADGLVARSRGDKQKAQAVFAAARKRLDATWGGKSKDEEYFVQVARLDAGLGRKDEAIREARQAVDLIPIAKDSFVGPEVATNLALVYAWTGEHDLAIEQLKLVAKIPRGPSYGELRFNPRWDSLRGDPRFEKIVASLAPR
jgi:TolB-like protein